MTEVKFFQQVCDVLEVDGPISRETALADFEEYDSLGILNLMTFYDEIGVETSQDDFSEEMTGNDLIALAGDKIDG